MYVAAEKQLEMTCRKQQVQNKQSVQKCSVVLGSWFKRLNTSISITNSSLSPVFCSSFLYFRIDSTWPVTFLKLSRC